MLFKVIRPKDTVYVGLYRRKDTNECSFVNLTKGHICPCKFSSVEKQSLIWRNRKSVVQF